MCGISGFNWKDEERVREMVSALSYRGPDANGVFVDEGISLGHNRLSIIDLSADANQPMFDNKNELSIVFNGEIYNFQELKKELEGEYEFKTKSDTEVILAGYRKWGREVVEKLNGMFAFAIWDKRDDSLYCARDHIGMKPFYYFWDPSMGSGQVKKFIFASEIRAILRHDIPRRLNLEAFNHYMRILYTPEPMTLVENLYKLPPSHSLLLKDGEISIKEYGQIVPNRSKLSYEDATSSLRSKVMEAVERHLVSDVPVGVYLSGGIDSSLVLSAMSKIHKGIKTFTIGFDVEGEDNKKKFNADFDLAQKTAEFFKTKHHPIVVSVKEALNALEEVVEHNSDPISNPTSIAMLLLARHAKKYVSVVLTGNAGDELFGGYDRYRKALIARLLYTTPDLFAKFMFEKDDKLSRVISHTVFIPDSKIKRYYEKYLVGSDVADSLMNADRRSWLPDHFFMLSDKMSMASALEERMPLADKELLTFSRSVPRQYKVDVFKTKKILKNAFKEDLPDFLFDQPKRGWFSPAAKWFRDPEFSKFARGVLSEDYYVGSKSLFNWKEVQEMLDRHINKKEYNLTLLWAILTFQMWAKKYKIVV